MTIKNNKPDLYALLKKIRKSLKDILSGISSEEELIVLFSSYMNEYNISETLVEDSKKYIKSLCDDSESLPVADPAPIEGFAETSEILSEDSESFPESLEIEAVYDNLQLPKRKNKKQKST